MYHINKDFIMREIGGEYILVATGEAAVRFSGLITLSESGYLLWKHLEQGGDPPLLPQVLTENYEVDAETAWRDAEEFLEHMKQNNILIENEQK